MNSDGVDQDVEDLAYRVIGAAIEVHAEIGPGFLESIYHNALAYELEQRSIAYQREEKVVVIFKEQVVGEGRIDLLVDQKLVVELKTVEAVTDTHRAQVSAYLKASGLRLGLLLNFNTAVMRDGVKRVIR